MMRPLMAIWVTMLCGVTCVSAATMEELAAEYKKRGEPIEPVDFEVKGVADADNAALKLTDAAKAFDPQSASWMALGDLDSHVPPLNEAQVRSFHSVAAENLKTFELIDEAMKRKSFDWGTKMTSPVFEILLPYLNKQRQLTNLVCADAVLMHHEGSHGQMLRDIERAMFISRAVDRNAFVVGHLVSIAPIAQSAHVLEMTIPTLKIGPAPAATPEQVKQLIALLLDDAPPRAGMRQGLLSERMSGLDIPRCIINGKLTTARMAQLVGDNNASRVGLITKESAAIDGVVLMRHWTDILAAYDSTTDYPTFKSRYPRKPAELGGDPKKHVLAKIMTPTFERVVMNHYRAVGDRRLMATALALKWFASENGGKLPAQLSDLVPKYLPAVPLDPMTAGKPLSYKADAGLIYSVGENEKDDGGSSKPIKPGATPTRWQRVDATFPVSSGGK